MKNLIEVNGLKTKKVIGDFVNGFSGRGNSSAIGLFNKDGHILHVDGKPYFPCGGRSAFISIIEQGCLKMEAFKFLPL